MSKQGIITDIQRYSVHDGPGIRTVVFFKGCPLRCRWCQNPETFSLRPELMLDPSLCIGCGACVPQCPKQLIEEDIAAGNSACDACGQCAAHCCTNARKIVGRVVSTDDVMKEVLEDETFYRNSGGGITLSGGEATMQDEFAKQLLISSKNAGLHTALETCGYCNPEVFIGLSEYINLYLYDIKHLNPQKHKEYTGKDNKLIIENLIALRTKDKDVILRIPLIPGVNDDEENLCAVAHLANVLGIKRIDILPFHQAGQAKWGAIGREYSFIDVSPMPYQEAGGAEKILRDLGLDVHVGGY